MAMTQTSIMEQRWSQRKEVTLNVNINFRGSELTQGTSYNIGLGGIFIKTNTHCLQNNQIVDLFFTMDGDSTRHKLRAKVIRELKDGYGLMFKDFDTNAFRSLQVIMKHSNHLKRQ